MKQKKVVTRIFQMKNVQPSTRLPASFEEQETEKKPKMIPQYQQGKKMRAPASKASDWSFESNFRKQLRRTSRQKLESDGIIEQVKDYKLDYKINH